MAIRREWGDVGTIGQLGALAGRAQAQREAQQQAFQMAQQQQAIQAQMAQQQMQIDQQNKALGIQLQRDQMQNEMQLAAQRMQMEWQAQMGVLDQQNKFQFEQYKWQARQQYELEKEMKYLAELDSRESALDRAYAEGDITDTQYARLKEMISAERYTGQPDDAVWRMEQALKTQALKEAQQQPKPERLPSSATLPRVSTGKTPIQETIEPYVDALSKLGTRAEYKERYKRESGWPTGTKWIPANISAITGSDRGPATLEEMLVAYDQWRSEHRYWYLDEAGRSALDAAWDNAMSSRFPQTWAPNLALVRLARGELVDPTSQYVTPQTPLTQEDLSVQDEWLVRDPLGLGL